MPAPQYAGWEARGTIRTTSYSFRTCSMTSTGTDLDVTNTEGRTGGGSAATPGYMAKIMGLRSCAVRATSATYDSGNNIFQTGGMVLAIGDYVSFTVEAFSGGLAHVVEQLLITELSIEFDVAGAQPITFAGVSDGFYSFGSP